MPAVPSLHQSLLSTPAAWRPNRLSREEEAAFIETTRIEFQQEEALFRHIMDEARNESSHLDDSLRDFMRLAFPNAGEDDIERAVATVKASTASWQNAYDKEGNPCWISLTLPERDESDEGLQPGGVLPSEAESAGPPKTDIEGKAEKDRERPGFFKRLFGGASSSVDPRRPPVTPASIAAGKGTIPPPKPRPLRGFIRLAVLAAVFAVIYHMVVVRGCTPKIF